MRLRYDLVHSFNGRLISRIFIALAIATFLIGFFSYYIAITALTEKGKVVLKNSVIQALNLIKSEHEKVTSGLIDEADAQERIKTILLGPLNMDGTRSLHRNIDLGEHGYFIIYDEKGVEIMHPTLEGKNVWSVTNINDKLHYIVQEQIEVALNGGGYTYYAWHFPHADNIGEKISYVDYYADWKWIVAATAYQLDFTNEAKKILYAIILVSFTLILFIGYAISRYIQSATKPVLDIAEGMKHVTEGRYNIISPGNFNDEIEVLITGYNNMIRSLKKAENEVANKKERLSYLAYNDDLTKLPNRNGLKEYVDGKIRNGCTAGYLAQLDIIGLKTINSILGYEQGDKVLHLFGEYLSQCDSKKCYAARTGSNEFSIWIEQMSQHQIHAFLEEIKSKGIQHVVESGYNHSIDMYLSLSILDSNIKTFETLYEETTTAMKSAKENQELSITLFEESMKELVRNELSMRSYLAKGISENEIIPYYQEKVDYITEEVVGVEALSRWFSSALGFVPPNVFIPYINQLNLITTFSEYMIERVLSDYQDLIKKYNSKLSISINISPSFFLEKSFIDKIKRAIVQYQIPPNKLILEITEDIFIADYKKVSEIIKQLHQMMVKVSIDDFGTGYSSLNYLMNIEPDEIKIDKSFVDQIIQDEKAFYMFDTLCKIADQFGYSIVAEGVENKDQLEKIKTTSLKIIQGYFFSKPEPLNPSKRQPEKNMDTE